MRLFRTFLAASAALLVHACGGTGGPSAADFTRAVYSPAYAAGFDIRGSETDSSTLLTVRNPWQAAGGIEQKLLLLRGGRKTPTDFAGQAVAAPVCRVVCMSTSHVAMFDALGEIGRVKGVSGLDYISNDSIRERACCGVVRDVGYDTNLDFELLASMRPDLVLLYGVTGENTVITGKFRELGIPYIYIGDYTEESPLGKAEWMVAVAELCDRRDRGQAVFEGIAGRYNALKATVDTTAVRPRVMLNTPYRDTWFMPSSRSYMIRLLEDAGGEYVYTKNRSDTSVAVELEEAYLLAHRADIWINTGACNTLGELTSQNPKFAGVPAVRTGRVWNNNRRQTARGGSDFWESGVVRPDRVLSDLMAVVRATDADTTWYYKRLE